MSRASSEAFADFTLSRMPHYVRVSLTDEQYKAVREALIAENKNARHTIDIRLSLPFFFRAFYLVIFCGRDKRKPIHQLELNRINRLPKPLRRGLYLLVSGLMILTLMTVILILLYLIKSHLGIDLFPDFHLRDVLPIDIYELSKVPPLVRGQ